MNQLVKMQIQNAPELETVIMGNNTFICIYCQWIPGQRPLLCEKNNPKTFFFAFLWGSSAATVEKKTRTVICPPWAVGWGSGRGRVHESGSCRPPCASDAGSRWAPGTPAHSACAPWSHWKAPATAASSFTGTVTQDWGVKQQLAVLVS